MLQWYNFGVSKVTVGNHHRSIYVVRTRSFLVLKFEFKFELQLSQPYPVLNLKRLIRKYIDGRWLYTWTTNEHAHARGDKSGFSRW